MDIKISKEDIPAATQLFTPEWIVRYMVENSLGRIWVEGHPDFDRSGWRYYLEEAEQTPEVKARLDALRESRKSLRPEEIKCIDPCAGSGHVLDYMFDVLLQIYESQGYNRRDAASLILKNNLYGLDIDERAAQLAYFSVMMKARGVDRKFFTRGVQPHVYDVPETYGELAKPSRKFDMGIQLYNAFRDGKEVGSLLDVGLSESELNQLKLQMDEMEQTGDATDLAAAYVVRPLWEIAMMLTQKYDVVVTNPPYMGSSNMDTYLSRFLKDKYPLSKGDLFAVFIERSLAMLKPTRYPALITQQSWMFLSSYEKLRTKLSPIDMTTILHLGAHAFEEQGGEVVQTVAFVLRNSNIEDYASVCDRLVSIDNAILKESAFCSGSYRNISRKTDFELIPAKPYAYWISKEALCNFKGRNLGSLAEIVSGMTTGNNEIYLRVWVELDFGKIAFGKHDISDIDLSRTKWIPYHKGGEMRKWYGNHEYVVNWSRSSEFNREKTTMTHVYLKPCITWSDISGNSFAGRYCFGGFMFDVKGSCAFSDEKSLQLLIGIFNSKITPVYIEALNPTTTTQVGDLKRIPLLIPEKGTLLRVRSLVMENVAIAKHEWDSFETSWDFQRHPLIDVISREGAFFERGNIDLAECYMLWEAEYDDRFHRLKANEEELNRIFIDIYGLRDELTPEVQDTDVTVRRADLGRDIRSLISYAVGCMFGRYALNVPGLVFAGGSFDDVYGSEEATLADHNGDTIVTHDGDAIALRIPYGVVKRDGREIPLSFRPDADNCILITDEPYFEDDIVGRFVDFIRVVYGAETLEENLAFIAKALDGRGNTSREVIRQYFLNDFYKDHLKIYQKRPIYWLFDSGKQNGFKALVYMHRWNADTVGNVRVEYMHRVQRVYEKEIARMKQVMESGSAREATAAAKRLDRLTKQLKETRDYDTRIAHAALSRVTIDLDDGVKVNYEKVQQGPDGKSLNLLAKIK